MVKTLPSDARGVGLIPGQGVLIPHTSWSKKQNIKQKSYCNKFNTDFKNDPYQKNLKKKKDKLYFLKNVKINHYCCDKPLFSVGLPIVRNGHANETQGKSSLPKGGDGSFKIPRGDQRRGKRKGLLETISYLTAG